GQDGPLPRELSDIVLGKVARAMDKAFTTAESVSISLISTDPAAHSSLVEARSLDRYFPADAAAGEALFRRDVYYLAKHLLALLGAPNALLHEATFSSVHALMRRRHAVLLAAARKGNLAGIAQACAMLAAEMQAQDQAPPLFAAQAPERTARYLCFSAIALAMGLATYADGEHGTGTLVESALLALQARPEKFERSIDASGDRAALADLFAFLIPHLP
ncbi:MAG: hypothetical protein ACRECY_11530, partial [Phyllobacterium sp.]